MAAARSLPIQSGKVDQTKATKEEQEADEVDGILAWR